MSRWIATVNYRTGSGAVDVVHDIGEIEDLHDLVERGPHWDTVESIVIVRNQPIHVGLTIEKAEQL